MCTGVILINILAAIHAWRFAHYDTHTHEIPQKPQDLSFKEKIKAIFLGVAIPVPKR